MYGQVGDAGTSQVTTRFWATDADGTDASTTRGTRRYFIDVSHLSTITPTAPSSGYVLGVATDGVPAIYGSAEFSNQSVFSQNPQDCSWSPTPSANVISTDIDVRFRAGTSDLARVATRVNYNTSTNVFTTATTTNKDTDLNSSRVTITPTISSGSVQVVFTYSFAGETAVATHTVEANQAQPRSHEGVLYYTATSTTAPDAPATSGLSYNFATRAITGLPATVTQNPITLPEGTTTANPYRVRYTVTEAFCGATSQTFAFGTPEQITTFGTDIQSDNFVTGSAGWQLERATGDAELNNVEVRGRVVSSDYNGLVGGTQQGVATHPGGSANVFLLGDIGTVYHGASAVPTTNTFTSFYYKTEQTDSGNDVFDGVKSEFYSGRV